MSEKQNGTVANRRDVLRSGAALGGGLLVSAFAGGSVAADADDSDGGAGVVGYIGRSSYQKLTGTEDVDCVSGADGWGNSFYVTGQAEDEDGETGVSVEVPDPSGSATSQQCGAYTVTATELVDLTGGPSGHGPWEQPCGSWVFLEPGAAFETGTVYQVGTVYGSGPMDAAVEDVTATDSDGSDIGSPMDLVRVSFERAPPAMQWTQHRELTGSGSTVAVDGTTAVLGPTPGAPATVLSLTDDGWTREGHVGDDTTSGPTVLSGDTVVCNADDGESGPVVVYARTGESWKKQATLRPEGLDSGAEFGYSFDVDGDTLVVGAPEADGTVDGTDGVVYVYRRTDGEWHLETTLEDTRDVDDTADGLGTDVAVSGDTVVAGAPYTTYYDFGYADVGGGLVFTRSAGEWGYEAFVRSDKPDGGDFQGEKVALEGDTAVLASPRATKDSPLTSGAGAAWVFTRDGDDWGQQAKLTPDDWSRGDWFGSSLSLSGDAILVGSNTRDDDGNDAKGAAYIFRRDGATWDQVVKLTAADGQSRDQFGSSVGLTDGFAFVGARSDPDGSDGSTYIFER